jgi:hypothetical protein
MSSGALLHERLGRLAPIAGQKMAAAAASADPDLHPDGGSGSGSEPKLLNDDQMKDFVRSGYVCLSVTEFPAAWHEQVYQRAHEIAEGTNTNQHEIWKALIGLGRIVVCATAHPLSTRFANIFGACISETTMRPNPRP